MNEYCPNEVLLNIFVFLINKSRDCSVNIFGCVFVKRKYSFFSNIIKCMYVCKRWYGLCKLNSIWFKIYFNMYERSIINGLNLSMYNIFNNKKCEWYEIFVERINNEDKFINDKYENESILHKGSIFYDISIGDNLNYKNWLSTIEQYSNYTDKEDEIAYILDNFACSCWYLYIAKFNNEFINWIVVYDKLCEIDKIALYSFEKYEELLKIDNYVHNIRVLFQYAIKLAIFSFIHKYDIELSDKYSKMSLKYFNKIICDNANIDTNIFNNEMNIFETNVRSITGYMIRNVKISLKSVFRDGRDKLNYTQTIKTIQDSINMIKLIYLKYNSTPYILLYYGYSLCTMAEYMIIGIRANIHNDIDGINKLIDKSIRKFNKAMGLIDGNNNILLQILKYHVGISMFIRTKVRLIHNKNKLKYVLESSNYMNSIIMNNGLMNKINEIIDHYSLFVVKLNNYYIILTTLMNNRIVNEDLIVRYYDEAKVIIDNMKDKPIKYYYYAKLDCIVERIDECKVNLEIYVERKRYRNKLKEVLISKMNNIYIRDIDDFCTIKHYQWFKELIKDNTDNIINIKYI